ncbi:glycosyltransferase family 2 protein [Thiomonas sp.]|uniref:glycosyltransferase family 2 protein n=1 Tax=Thiomonas sp. TaxID=2047785 RepID=UPI002638D629|nr:glycosyltransferase family 2 protein [Thiomonas sp.]
MRSSSLAGRSPADLLLAGTLLLAVGLLFYLGLARHALQPLLSALHREGWHRVVLEPAVALGYLGLGLSALRVALWAAYRPTPPAAPADAPMLTVVIPAYNEGAMVERSIDSVARAHYPPGRLQILAVDDGSRDDTWEHMQRAAARHPRLVRTVRLPSNRGKRAALAAGFAEARGEVLVTIDSDSVIEAGTLLAMVAPFRDSRVGAVAGRVAVLNRFEGLIPRMLHVRYALSFDFLRAAQSTLGNVVCCPGALSAYRASAVRRALPAWLGQRFLGQPCTIGEDRAMTNHMFALGYDVRYQSDAVVHTMAPTTYRGLCKMFLRWSRSQVREDWRLLGLLRARPLPARLVAGLDLLTTDLGYVFGLGALALALHAAVGEPRVLGYMAGAVMLGAAPGALYFLRLERSLECLYGLAYGLFSALALFWIMPYAAVTVRARGWLTR